MSKYMCERDWLVDGITVCSAGKLYEVTPAKPEKGESEEAVAGYCDVLGCDDGKVLNTSYLEVEEYMCPAPGNAE